jgi:hypothetical protein
MRHLRHVGFAVLALMLLEASEVSAQRTPTRASSQAAAQQGGFWELGADAGITLRLDDPMTVFISIPVTQLRAGYYTSNVLSIEPVLRINSSFGKDQTAFTSYLIGAGVLYHLTPDRTKSQTYMRPFLAINSTSGPGNVTFTTLGFGAGMKRPMFRGRAASRGELNLSHRLESSGIGSLTALNALLGLSFYTR